MCIYMWVRFYAWMACRKQKSWSSAPTLPHIVRLVQSTDIHAVRIENASACLLVPKLPLMEKTIEHDGNGRPISKAEFSPPTLHGEELRGYVESEQEDQSSVSSAESEEEEGSIDKRADQAKAFIGQNKDTRMAQAIAKGAEARFLSFLSNPLPTSRTTEAFDHAYDNFIVKAGSLAELYKGPLIRQLRSLRATARIHARLCRLEGLSVHKKSHHRSKRSGKKKSVVAGVAADTSAKPAEPPIDMSVV